MVKDHGIPPELIYFWDEYGQNLVPTSKCTFAKKGSVDIIIQGLDDKRQITGTLCHNGKLEFVGGQLIFQVISFLSSPLNKIIYIFYICFRCI